MSLIYFREPSFWEIFETIDDWFEQMAPRRPGVDPSEPMVELLEELSRTYDVGDRISEDELRKHAKRVARRHWNRKAQKSHRQALDQSGEPRSREMPAEEIVENTDQCMRITRAISPRDQDAFLAFYGLTGNALNFKELAAQSGKTELAVKKKHRRLRCRLSRDLSHLH